MANVPDSRVLWRGHQGSGMTVQIVRLTLSSDEGKNSRDFGQRHDWNLIMTVSLSSKSLEGVGRAASLKSTLGKEICKSRKELQPQIQTPKPYTPNPKPETLDQPGVAREGDILQADTMCSLMSFRKSTPPQNRELDVSINNSTQ